MPCTFADQSFFCQLMSPVSTLLNSALSLTVNNVLNTKPPFDRTYDGSQGFAPPFYNIFAYNGYGRAFWVQYRIDFGTNN